MNRRPPPFPAGSSGAEPADVDVGAAVGFLRALASSTTSPTPPAGDGELAGALHAVGRLVAAERQERARADEAVVDAEVAWQDAVDLLLSANVDDLALRRANHALVAAVGLPRETLVGAPLLSLFVERSHADVREAVRAIVAGERPPAVDLELATAIDGRGKDGGPAPQRRMVLVRLRGHVMRRAGQAPRLNIALRDVTDERALEGRLLEAQKLEALGRLAGSVAHDFNNLLVVMQGTIDMLVPLLHGEGAEDVAAFSEAARRATQITGQLLAFSRQELVRHGDVDVARVVARARPILERLAGRTVRIDVAIDDGLPPAHIDETRLHQVLVNLVVNARDAMPDGGVVAIGARAQTRIVNGVPRPGVRLTVQDTGPGIPPELRKTIFEPFFTTKPPGKGTGLGLSTVHGIIHQAGGDIAVDGNPGDGARFLIDLPVTTTSTLPSTRTPLRSPGPRGAGQRILLVEDDAFVRAVTARVLRGAGYTVHEADGDVGALALVRQHPLDLVVVDVGAPGASTPLVIEALRAVQSQLPALLVSSVARDAPELALADDTPFLQKPYLPGTLLAAVRGVLSSTGRSPPIV